METPTGARPASRGKGGIVDCDVHNTLTSFLDPHWDFDDPFWAFRQVPNNLKWRIFSETARESYELPARQL